MISPPDEVTHVDFETRSKAKLRDLGGRRYVEHPTTEVVCAVLRMPGWPEVLYTPFPCVLAGARGGDWQGPPKLRAVCAHNGTTFDRHVWRKLGWPEPEEWIDTSYLARVAGMPKADLDWLGTNLCGVPKDLEGSKLTKKLSAVSRARKRLGQYQVDLAANPDILERVIRYCASDVALMAQLWEEHFHEWYGMDLDGYERAQIAMNDRGILFDVELAEALLEADAILADDACRAAGVPQALVRSNQQMMAEMARRGCPVDNCQAETFDELESNGAIRLPPAKWYDVLALIKARRACSSIAAGKLRAGLARVSPDGRLRDNTRIYGAHTGRESGQGVQVQNLAGGPPLDIPATLQLFDQGQLKAVHIVE